MERAENASEISSQQLVSVAVVVNRSKSSKYAIKWALDKLIPEGNAFLNIIHIRPRITMVSTPMGNIPITQVRDDIASAYKKEAEWQTVQMLLPLKKLCSRRQVEAELIIIEADDIPGAISETVKKMSFSKLVIGAPSQNLITWKMKRSKMSSRISGCIPTFCTVYAVCKGRLLSIRASSLGECGDMTNENNISDSQSFSSHSSGSKSDWTETDSLITTSISHTPYLDHHFIDMSSGKCGSPYSSSVSSGDDGFLSTRTSISEPGNSEYLSVCSNMRSGNIYYDCSQLSSSENITDSSLSEDSNIISIELERLRTKLQHVQEMCKMAEIETFATSQQLKELSTYKMEEAITLEDLRSREAKARDLAEKERKQRVEAEKEAKYVKECAEEEACRRLDAEDMVACEMKEKERLEHVLAFSNEPYKKYTWEEIELATTSLSDSLKIGTGANGAVYRGSFRHTTAAVKVLHSHEVHRTKQFKQELEILGRTRHPHLLLLLGACPENGCLVYEYMENGSLDDRLHCQNGTPPLPWYYRFRIAWEIASALVFLHNAKPKPIIHRDLKPANILLDANFVSKIGDVGLSTLLPDVSISMSTIYKNTAPVGTICYIDPEYQRTGLVSPKSDVYALGIVILELLTAKLPMGVAHVMESALEDGCLMNVLDSGAGRWPMQETEELARLGLQCAELRRRDRPDLRQAVLPVLERLKRIGDTARDMVHYSPSGPPDHFLCPILKKVMDDPCVASDGYTYDRRAIEMWFSMNDKSPMSNLLLLDKALIPNHSLLAVIEDWKCKAAPQPA